jgi:hypothetical protein
MNIRRRAGENESMQLIENVLDTDHLGGGNHERLAPGDLGHRPQIFVADRMKQETGFFKGVGRQADKRSGSHGRPLQANLTQIA